MCRGRLLASLVALLLGGCEAAGTATDASLDAPIESSTDSASAADVSSACSLDMTGGQFYVDHATPSPDGAGWCCPRGTPSCGCGYFGGFVHSRCSCGQIDPTDPTDTRRDGLCDLAPPDWILSTDAHGCMAYSARPTPTLCCNCPDADMSDAFTMSDAGS